MYKKVNITENHLKILSLFTKGFNREYYIRETSKSAEISPRTAQLILNDLEQKAVLESRTKGKIKIYSLKKTIEAKEYLTLAEDYKRICFFESNSLIKEVIEKIYPKIKGAALIFGSYAKETHKKGSDLDIFIAGKCNEEYVYEISKRYNIKISLKIYSKKAFKNKADYLVKEVLENHILIKGIEQFMEVRNG